MGCTGSIPIASEFDQPHQTGNSLAFGKYDDVCKSEIKTQLIVREKFFSWSGDTFIIKQPDGRVFGDLGANGKAISLRDQMILQNNITKEPIAICLKKLTLLSPTSFKIYTTTANFSGQVRSVHEYDGSRLYTFAEIVRVPFSRTDHVFLTKSNKNPDQLQAKPQIPDNVIERVGPLWPKKRVVKHRGRPAALMEGGGNYGGIGNTYLLTICPGIDPCLIICLCAICDEFDE